MMNNMQIFFNLNEILLKLYIYIYTSKSIFKNKIIIRLWDAEPEKVLRYIWHIFLSSILFGTKTNNNLQFDILLNNQASYCDWKFDWDLWHGMDAFCFQSLWQFQK
jgi:hypothetical protein